MQTKIGLISDVHATAGPLSEAYKIFEQEGANLVLCLGDIAGYGSELEQCIQLLTERGCVGIRGNHDGWYIDQKNELREKKIEQFFRNLTVTWQSVIAGKRVFAVHASPPSSMNRGITLLDQYENIMFSMRDQWALELEKYGFDVLLVGHTHQVYAEQLGQTLVINPGSTKFNNTCAILSLPDLRVQFFPLAGGALRKVWHWGVSRRATS